MYEASELIAVAVVVLGMWMVGVTQLRSTLAFFSVQTVLLGMLAFGRGWQHHEFRLEFIGVLFLVLKGMGIPVYLSSVIERIGCRRDDGLVIAPPLLMFLALAGFSALLLNRPFASVIPLSAVPAVGLLLIGMLLMMTRRLAISQIIGFLVLENGIFLYTVSQPHAMPVLVEMGVLLDILMWTMVAGVLVFRISHSFEHIDVTALKELHE